MIGKLTLAAGLIAVGLLAIPQTTTAASLPQTPLVDTDKSVVQQVRHRHRRYRIVRLHRHRVVVYPYIYLSAGRSYCSTWRHECGHRWGWRTRGYCRCLYRHGC